MQTALTLALWGSGIGKVLATSQVAYQLPSVCAVDSFPVPGSVIAGVIGVTSKFTRSLQFPSPSGLQGCRIEIVHPLLSLPPFKLQSRLWFPFPSSDPSRWAREADWGLIYMSHYRWISPLCINIPLCVPLLLFMGLFSVTWVRSGHGDHSQHSHVKHQHIQWGMSIGNTRGHWFGPKDSHPQGHFRFVFPTGNLVQILLVEFRRPLPQ